MGHEQHGLLAVAPHPQQQLLHLQARLAVESAEGFVHQQDLRVIGQCAGNGDTLHHPAGQLLGVVVGKAAQAHFVHVVIDDVLALRRRHATPLEAELDVLPHRQPREQRVALEHHAAVRAGAFDLLAANVNLTRGRFGQAGGEIQQARLAAARRPHQHSELLVRHFERHFLQRGKGTAIGFLVTQADLVHLQPGGVHRGSLGGDKTMSGGGY
ncbi:hypothetical protein D3C85_807840 [compost metagenome]